jgi:hypothetical protein
MPSKKVQLKRLFKNGSSGTNFLFSRTQKTRKEKNKRTKRATTSCPSHHAPPAPSVFWAALHLALTSARNVGGAGIISRQYAEPKLLSRLVSDWHQARQQLLLLYEQQEAATTAAAT